MVSLPCGRDESWPLVPLMASSPFVPKNGRASAVDAHRVKPSVAAASATSANLLLLLIAQNLLASSLPTETREDVERFDELRVKRKR